MLHGQQNINTCLHVMRTVMADSSTPQQYWYVSHLTLTSWHLILPCSLVC